MICLFFSFSGEARAGLGGRQIGDGAGGG